tara:strand:+ start:226 stop:1203 length:978 start_codon:yes stop_codon:yes gene_type:complete
MPCPTNAPINLSTSVVQQCSSKCNFEYNYGLASCIVTNKNTYLDISCYDGNNTVKSDMIGKSLTVSGVRLYAPSLNSYNGFKSDAELIVMHTGGGKTLYVCIPIISSEKAGLSAKWFSQIIPFLAGLKKNDNREIRVSNFTLNDVIPKAAFTIFENGTFDFGGCAQDNVLILFHKTVAINMKGKDYRDLTKLIGPASYALQSNPTNLQFNSKGTIAGPGGKSGSGAKGRSMTCSPINNPDGTPITNSKKSWIPDPPQPDEEKYTGLGVGYIILIIIAAILVIGGLGYFLYYAFNKSSWRSVKSSVSGVSNETKFAGDGDGPMEAV